MRLVCLLLWSAALVLSGLRGAAESSRSSAGREPEKSPRLTFVTTVDAENEMLGLKPAPDGSGTELALPVLVPAFTEQCLRRRAAADRRSSTLVGVVVLNV